MVSQNTSGFPDAAKARRGVGVDALCIWRNALRLLRPTRASSVRRLITKDLCGADFLLKVSECTEKPELLSASYLIETLNWNAIFHNLIPDKPSRIVEVEPEQKG